LVLMAFMGKDARVLLRHDGKKNPSYMHICRSGLALYLVALVVLDPLGGLFLLPHAHPRVGCHNVCPGHRLGSNSNGGIRSIRGTPNNEAG